MLKKHLRQTFANIEQGVREPTSIGRMFRAGLVALWHSRGGGLYGLGYVVYFVILEVVAVGRQIAETVAGDASLIDWVMDVLVRFGADTLSNMIQSFIWPVWVLQGLQGWGVLLLAVGFASFNRFLRPLLERLVPELAPPAIDETKNGSE